MRRRWRNGRRGDGNGGDGRHRRRASDLLAGDLNSDGLADLIVRTPTHWLVILSKGSFFLDPADGLQINPAEGLFPGSAAWGDVTGDCAPELVTFDASASTDRHRLTVYFAGA